MTGAVATRRSRALSPWSTAVGQGSSLPVPGPVLGRYPLREVVPRTEGFWSAWLRARWQVAGTPSARERREWLERVHACQTEWRDLSAQPDADGGHQAAMQRLRARMHSEGFSPRVCAETLAWVGLTLQQHTGWTLHDGQWLAAWWMLEHRLVEMATGEGKSAAVVLAAASAALAGVPVHVMTSNDYLAQRDAAQWRPVYAALGLEVGCVAADTGLAARQQAHALPVVYTTAREVVFDHLRDRAARAQGRPADVVLRGLCMALIDEADSILIDEACTPLILSREVPSEQTDQAHRIALFLARQLRQGEHFTAGAGRAVALRPAGEAELQRLGQRLPAPWPLRRYREDQVQLALTALHGLHKDVHYLIRDDQVHLIDGPTGRLAQGRLWSRGLHQMVCLKEQLRPGARTETLMQTTYQEFFPRYFWLGGLSGTLREERHELLATYGLGCVSAPLRRPSQRQLGPTRWLPDEAAKWQAVAQRVSELAAQGRAVLVGVETVAECEAASAVLQRAGQAHQLLHARHDGLQDDHERDLVAQAGQPGRVTLATHMAGRGTDVALSAEVLAVGGLHVVAAHLHPSARIDRQLFGRSARQGQPGSAERFVSAHEWRDSPAGKGWVGTCLGLGLNLTLGLQGGGWTRRWGEWLCRWHQSVHRAQARRARWALLENHRAMRQQLSLAGKDDWI